MYFQVCSNSTYPQHSGERYRTSYPLVFTLFLDYFCVLIVKIRYELCKICGVEKLLNNMFGHNIEQLLS